MLTGGSCYPNGLNEDLRNTLSSHVLGVHLKIHHSSHPSCRSAVDSPACGPIRLCAGDPERIALHLCRPSCLLAVQLGYLLQRRLIGNPSRFAFQHEVDTFKFDRNRAGWVRRQVARLAGLRPADDIEVAVEPKRSGPGGVRATIRSHRSEEECDIGSRRAGCEEIARYAPRQCRGSIAVEIDDLDRCAVGHLFIS